MELLETYKGININIWHDTGAENPFENWDGCMPLISDSGSRGYYKDYSDGDILSYLRDFLTYNQIRRNQTRLLKMIGYDVEKEKQYSKLDNVDLSERIQDDYLYSFLNDGIENMEIFCKEFNIKHYKSCSRGYSQSDWADVFICWTPKFEEITGRTYKSITDKDFESAFKLFSDWAWGDVYGFTIEDFEDSCGGFYGDDHEKSDLLNHAKQSIDVEIDERRKAKQSKLKKLIKAKVPLNYR